MTLPGVRKPAIVILASCPTGWEAIFMPVKIVTIKTLFSPHRDITPTNTKISEQYFTNK